MGFLLTFFRHIFRFILLALVLCIAGTGQVNAAEPLTLMNGTEPFNLAPHLQILRDPTGELTLAQVRQAGSDKSFMPYRGESLRLPQSQDTIWLRFRLKSVKGAPRWLMELGKPFINHADLYLPHRDQDGKLSFQTRRTGIMHPLSTRDLPYRTIVFKLPTELDGKDFFYLRLVSSTALSMQVLVWPEDSFHKRSWTDTYIYGILNGSMLCMVLFNLILYFSLKSRVYLYYVAYMGCNLIYQVAVHGQLYMFAGWHGEIIGILAWGFIALSFTFAARFSQVFLDTYRHTPLLHKAFYLYMATPVSVMIASLAGNFSLANELTKVVSMTGVLLSLSAGIICWVRGFGPARYFLAAWGVMLGGSVVFVLAVAGLVPSTFFTYNALLFGVALESVLLSFALADRIRVLRIEQRRYQVLSQTDALTGLYNKRFLDSSLTDAVTHARQTGTPLSIIMLDVDNFKQFNDTYGHAEGDKVLTRLAQVMLNLARDGDSPCRYGGEEFTMVLAGADAQGAMVVAERVRINFARSIFRPGGEHKVRVTVSSGVAQLKDGETAEQLIRRADKALYDAKEDGKNLSRMAV